MLNNGLKYFSSKIHLCILLVACVFTMTSSQIFAQISDWDEQLEEKESTVVEQYQALLRSGYFNHISPKKLLPADFATNIKHYESGVMALVEELQKNSDADSWILLNNLGSLCYMYLHKTICSLKLPADNQLFLLDTLKVLHDFKTEQSLGTIAPFRPTIIKLNLSIHSIQSSNLTINQKEQCLNLVMQTICKELTAAHKKYSAANLNTETISSFVTVLKQSFVDKKFVVQANAHKNYIKKIVFYSCIALCIASVAYLAWNKYQSSRQRVTARPPEDEPAHAEARAPENGVFVKTIRALEAMPLSIGRARALREDQVRAAVDSAEDKIKTTMRTKIRNIQQTIDTETTIATTKAKTKTDTVTNAIKGTGNWAIKAGVFLGINVYTDCALKAIELLLSTTPQDDNDILIIPDTLGWIFDPTKRIAKELRPYFDVPGQLNAAIDKFAKSLIPVPTRRPRPYGR